MPDVAVRDKQVVVVRQDSWVQVKEFFIKTANTVAIRVGEGGMESEDLRVKCNYLGEVSIDDDALGIVFDRDGDMNQIKQIITIKTQLLTTLAILLTENPLSWWIVEGCWK